MLAQSGQTCNTAIQNYSKDSCSYQSWIITGTEMWFNFKANTPYVYISVITTKFGINAPHVHMVELYDGTCSNPILIADDELPFVDYWDELRIDLDASGLIPGNKYYIRLSRQPSGGKLCDKSTCRAMIQPAGFDICIQDVDVFIPPDSSLEQPSIAHQYIQNKGQIIDVNGNPRPDIIMVAPNASPVTYVANNAAYFVFAKIDTSIFTIDTLHRVAMTLVGANPNARTFKTEQTPGRTNYFLAHTPKGVSAKGFSRLVWNDVYPKIDMQFYSNKAGIKHYFVIRQGGDAENIKMKFDGATQVNITNYGGLEIVTSIGKMQFDPGHAYQINPAGNPVPMPWQAKFLKVSSNEVVFDIRNYAPNMPLIIQVDRGHTFPPPPISNLDWCSYVGGSGSEAFNDIVSDKYGNIFIAGYTSSINFPVSNGIDTIYYANTDMVALKFNALTGQLLWNTFYGGDGSDYGLSIAVNSLGDVYFFGDTKSKTGTIPKKPPYNINAFYQPLWASQGTGYEDAFIVKIDSTGSNLHYATYLGGNGYDFGKKILIDKSDNVFITGYTMSSNFPRYNPGGNSFYQDSLNGNIVISDIYIIKFDSAGVMLWGTYYGGDDEEKAFNLAVDLIDNLYIIGSTGSTNFPIKLPTKPGAHSQNNLKGVSDAFILKFNNTGKQLWAVFYGGSGGDEAQGIFIDSLNNIIISGFTASSDFPAINPLQIYKGNIDAFIIKSDTSCLISWSTPYGGSEYDYGKNIIIHRGVIYMFGETKSPNIQFPSPNPLNTFSVTVVDSPLVLSQGYIIAFNFSFTPIWGSYFGIDTTGGDRIYGSATASNYLFIVGTTNSVNYFPLADPGGNAYYQGSFGGYTSDAYIARFDLTPVINARIIENYYSLSDYFSLYPNPSNGKLFIKCSPEHLLQKLEINVYNISGQNIFSDKITISTKNYFYPLNLTFSPGTYLLKLNYNEQNINQKFIINY